jgi:hypothetical protein
MKPGLQVLEDSTRGREKTIMLRLDRLPWRDQLSFSTYDARIGIRSNEAGILSQLHDRLPPVRENVSWALVDDIYSIWVAPGASPGSPRHRLYAGRDRIARTADLGQIYQAFESRVHFNIARRARGKLFVHAGVVGWRGSAIVIPGRSRSGKTSLVAAFVRAGAAYYSDEYAVFDGQGFVHPYPKRLSFRDSQSNSQLVSVGEIGGSAGTRPLPVGLVIVTQYQSGTHWQPKRMSPGEALLALLDNTVNVREEPQLALSTLRTVVEGCRTIAGERGEARDLALQILAQEFS